jgi:WD40 repeat protein
LPDGKHIVSSLFDETMTHCVWDIQAGEHASRFSERYIGIIYFLAFSPDGKCIASGSSDNVIRIRDVQAGNLMSGTFEPTDPPRFIAFLLDRKYIVSANGGV